MTKKDGNIEWRSVCPICSGLDVLGDKWTMLIIRDLIIHGPLTYSEFLESPEHISTNILADRLDLLVNLKLIERVCVTELFAGVMSKLFAGRNLKRTLIG